METIETLNQRLVEHYGIDTDTSQPIYRIVWANDQLEKRKVYHSEAGIKYLFPEVVEVKKYSYLKDLYVMERLSIVPPENEDELPTSKLSYEPVWTFCDKHRNPIPPIWDAIKFIVDTIQAARGKKSLRNYVEDEKESTPEGKEQRIQALHDELFGNETAVGDALKYKSGIVVP